MYNLKKQKNKTDNLLLFFSRMDCLIKTVKSEGYFGMYRGKTIATLTTMTSFNMCLVNSLLQYHHIDVFDILDIL